MCIISQAILMTPQLDIILSTLKKRKEMPLEMLSSVCGI